MPSSIFVRDQRQYIEDLAHNFSSRMRYDNGSYSEPLMYLACYKDWIASEKKMMFSRSRSLSHSRMAQVCRVSEFPVRSVLFCVCSF
jgi:hypothetical protein